MWRFRGTPFYLDAQGERLGLSKVLVDRARTNAEIHRVSTLLGQLCERYHRAARNGDAVQLCGPELAQVRGTLGQAEHELDKLIALAAAGAAMIDEAHRAFGLPAPERTHRVICDYDDPPSPSDLKPIKVQANNARAAKVG